MRLSAGQHIGHYTLDYRLGAGGVTGYAPCEVGKGCVYWDAFRVILATRRMV
ncbi:MAG: hypothetical protein AAFV53_33085 [Myxococcota bacterium]